jgi:hypothetical protein
MGAMDDLAVEAWLENMAMCFTLRDYTSNMKVCMAVFQLKGEHSTLVEDTPTSTKHGRSKTCHGSCLRNSSGRGTCLRNSLSTNLMSSTPYDRVVIWCQSMRPGSWSYLGMLHI